MQVKKLLPLQNAEQEFVLWDLESCPGEYYVSVLLF